MLVIVGLAMVAGYFGYRAVTSHSDAQLQREAAAAQLRAGENLAKLAAQPAQVPAECLNINSNIFFELCDIQRDEENEPAPDWALTGNPNTRKCVVAAFHRTNERAYTLQQRDYLPATPSSANVLLFACDVAGAGLFTEENYKWGDPNIPLNVLLTTYYKDRAELPNGAIKSY